MPECPYCGKWFRGNTHLKQHIIKVHTTKGVLGERTLNPFSIDVLAQLREDEKEQ